MADAPPAIPEITEEELAKRKKKIEDAFLSNNNTFSQKLSFATK